MIFNGTGGDSTPDGGRKGSREADARLERPIRLLKTSKKLNQSQKMKGEEGAFPGITSKSPEQIQEWGASSPGQPSLQEHTASHSLRQKPGCSP